MKIENIEIKKISKSPNEAAPLAPAFQLPGFQGALPFPPGELTVGLLEALVCDREPHLLVLKYLDELHYLLHLELIHQNGSLAAYISKFKAALQFLWDF